MAIEAKTAFAVEKQRKPWQFQPGQSGNPAGRRPGSRNAVSEAFLADCYTVWQEQGIDALRMTAATDPARFCTIISQLVPRDLQITADLRVEHAVSALEAYRLLKATPATELKQIKSSVDAEDA